ncbi:hypothetical protein ACJMK2_000442 [Sinanodonta woodiana]|uniref:SWIM-type domain-containing protein n=1 Tax=Sinanodonta woodiana TaxID=1069815 RepID=A0ABD3XR12_SINWO
MSFGYKETLDSDAYARYLQKLQVVEIKDCPYKFPADLWVNNPTKWPEVTWPDVYNYLTDTPGVYTRETMKNYKSLEAHNFLLSGWADVKPSWRVTEEPHHPWVAVTNEGRVIAAHCDCMAGLGESCSHVGALLFKIEAAVRNGYTRLACTEKPSPVTSIQFYSDKAKKRLRESIRTRKPPLPPPPASEQLPIGLSTFKETAHLFACKDTPVSVRRLPMPLISLYDPSCIKLTKEQLVEKCKQILPTVSVSASENEYLMESSVAYSVLHTNMDCPAMSIIKKICNPVQQELKSKPVQWDRLHEATALKHYSAAISTQHQDVKITRTGLGLCMEKGFIGASPDALFSCSCCGNAVVEIKCPYTLKDANVDEILSATNYCLASNVELKKDHNYYAQVQLQMYVFKNTLCHFVVWTNKACIISVVNKDQIFIDNMVKKLEVFWIDHCLPELLTQRQEKG